MPNQFSYSNDFYQRMCDYQSYAYQTNSTNKNMKYYKVKEDTFMWEKGAIISDEGCSGQYRSINPIWDKLEDQKEWIGDSVIEDKVNAKYFERVYPVNLITKTVYKLKEEAKQLLAKEHTN